LIWIEGKMETATAAAWPEAVGFVLAGGRSARMGSDKALVQLDGLPLLAHAIGILQEAGLAASVAGGQPGLSAFAPLVEDNRPGLGPLGGICAALASTSAPWAVFLSVDLPLLPASLLGCLLQHARIRGRSITVASVNGFAQTFPAVVSRASLPVFEFELESGRGGCFSAFQAAAASLGEPVTVLPVESLLQCGQVAHAHGMPAARWFLNVNTAEDLRRAMIHSVCVHRVS
jgi:molybdopterin-guanine dinucleotide biosynthesis protein A